MTFFFGPAPGKVHRVLPFLFSLTVTDHFLHSLFSRRPVLPFPSFAGPTSLQVLLQVFFVKFRFVTLRVVLSSSSPGPSLSQIQINWDSFFLLLYSPPLCFSFYGAIICGPPFVDPDFLRSASSANLFGPPIASASCFFLSSPDGPSDPPHQFPTLRTSF